MRRTLLIAALLFTAGCARQSDKPASSLTEAQRDSAIAKSDLPGAAAVGGALKAAGQEQKHAAQVDSSGGHY